MDWKQFAIDKLGDYNARKQALISIPLLIAEIDAAISEVRSARTDRICVTETAKNVHEDKLLNCIAKKTELQQSLKQVRQWVKSVDGALAALNPEERRILERMYISCEKKAAENLAEELFIDKKTVYYRNTRALRKFTIALYGYVES